MTASAPPFTVPWRIRDALLAVVFSYLAFLGVALVLCAVIGVGLGVQGIDLSESTVVEELIDRLFSDSPWFELLFLVQALLMVYFIMTGILRRWSVTPHAFVVKGQAAWEARYAVGLFIKCVLVSAAVILGIMGLIAGASLLMHQEPTVPLEGYLSGLERESQVILSPQIGWLRIALATVVGPPIEELLYRGSPYAALRKRLSAWKANLISSGAFALGHHYVFGLPNILLIGILGAHAYERTRSLRAPILFHILWNTFCATVVKPVLWPVLLVAMAGLLHWSRRAAQPASATPAVSTSDRRVGWKLYAVVVIGLAIVGGVSQPELAWHLLVEWPMYAALVLYAWGHRKGSGRFWRAYGVCYVVWLMIWMWKETTPESMTVAFLAFTESVRPVLAGPVSWDLFLIAYLGTYSLYNTLLAPSVVVLWRVARERW